MAEKLKFRAKPGYLILDGENVIATGAHCRAVIGDRVEEVDSRAPIRMIQIDNRDYRVVSDEWVQIAKTSEE